MPKRKQEAQGSRGKSKKRAVDPGKTFESKQ